MPFANRTVAGERLGAALKERAFEHPVVLALPRGGVPVGAEVAEALGAPLDVLVVRKLGVPYQPELGMGAIGEDGARVLNEQLIQHAGVSRSDLERVTAREQAELARRVRTFRGDRARVPLHGCTAVIVDDGLATGFTARAAVEVARHLGAAQVVVAVPVGPPDTVEALRQVADEVVCLETPRHFWAIGEWYTDFHQLDDAEVARQLAGSRHEPTSPAPSAAAHVTSHDDPPGPQVVSVRTGGVSVPGRLHQLWPRAPMVVFAHGSGSSWQSPRNQAVAEHLSRHGIGTLLFDLLTPTEATDRTNVFDIGLLTERMIGATTWLRDELGDDLGPLGLFGASTGAAAALDAAAALGAEVQAVVSRGGRPDLGHRLHEVRAPTLLIVGGDDDVVLDLNREAARRLQTEHALAVVPGASHLFEEPGALDTVMALAAEWFGRWLTARPAPHR